MSVCVYRTCVSVTVAVAAVYWGLVCAVLSSWVPRQCHQWIPWSEWPPWPFVWSGRPAGFIAHPSVSWSPAWYSQTTYMLTRERPCRQNQESGFYFSNDGELWEDFSRRVWNNQLPVTCSPVVLASPTPQLVAGRRASLSGGLHYPPSKWPSAALSPSYVFPAWVKYLKGCYSLGYEKGEVTWLFHLLKQIQPSQQEVSCSLSHRLIIDVIILGTSVHHTSAGWTPKAIDLWENVYFSIFSYRVAGYFFLGIHWYRVVWPPPV